MPQVVIHHLGLSQSERIVWLCEELEIDYGLIRYERETGMAPAAYRALHPMGIAPVVDIAGLILAESGAIIDYLTMEFGGGRLVLPRGHPRLADWLFWFHFANGTMLPAAMMEIVGRMLGGGDSGGGPSPLSVRMDRGLAMLELALTSDRWLGGDDFTTADIMMVFPLTTMRVFAPRDLGSFPAVRAYLSRIGERPAYVRAMAKCEPDLSPMLA